MANPSGNPTQTGYGTGDVNQSPQAATATFADYEAYGSPGPQVVAAFSFTILSGGVAVYSLADSVSLSLDSGSPVITYAAPVALKGFHLLTPAGSQAAVAYQWDATTIDVPLGVSLAPGESSTLTYQTSVTTSTNILYPDLTAQVLAFAGFGDPIGKSTGGGGIPDPYFAQLVLAYPTFDPVTGKVGLPALPKSLPSLTFPGQSPATYEPVPDAVLGVPEPGAWALMLAGLALVGGAGRRRQRAA